VGNCSPHDNKIAANFKDLAHAFAMGNQTSEITITTNNKTQQNKSKHSKQTTRKQSNNKTATI